MPKHNHNAIGLVIPHVYSKHADKQLLTNQVQSIPKRPASRPANVHVPNTASIKLPEAIQQIVDGNRQKTPTY